MAAARMRIDTAERGLRLRRELADHLFENVLERHEALQVAILVDDEGDAPPEPAEPQQLLVERRSLRREERLAAGRDLPQPLARQAAGRELVGNEAHVHDAVHAVELSLEQRHAR